MNNEERGGEIGFRYEPKEEHQRLRERRMSDQHLSDLPNMAIQLEKEKNLANKFK